MGQPPSAYGGGGSYGVPYDGGYGDRAPLPPPASARGGGVDGGGGGGGVGGGGGKSMVESISEACYFAAAVPQALGGSGMRAVFKSAAAGEQAANASAGARLTAPCFAEYLAARGCSVPLRELEALMARFGEGGAPGLSFSQFMRLMAEASPARA